MLTEVLAFRNFGELLACRTLMGVFEAAFLPCAVYYCSLFYTRRELGFRTAIFYQMGVIAVSDRPASLNSIQPLLSLDVDY